MLGDDADQELGRVMEGDRDLLAGDRPSIRLEGHLDRPEGGRLGVYDVTLARSGRQVDGHPEPGPAA